MSIVVLEMDHVCKKFKKGEIYDSLRDLIPAMAGRLLRRGRNEALSKNEFWALTDVSFQITGGESFGSLDITAPAKVLS